MALRLSIDRIALAAFCRNNAIGRLSLFGSILRADFSGSSDIDVLVEFLPRARVGLIRMAALQLELSELLGRPVDLRTPQDLSPYFRETVLNQAEVQYAA